MVATLVAVIVAAAPVAAGPAPLGFAELFRPGAARLEPSERLRALDGARVRMTGYMAHMEDGPAGAFYLASRPVACDEGGAGTGDLPPDAVLVVVPWAAGEEIPWLPGPLEVTGVLHLGPATRPDGAPARLRIVLDPPAPKPAADTPKTEGGRTP